jgi:hypothetical protein
MTKEKTEELTDPSLRVVLMKRPGDVTTLSTLLPGDAFGVEAEEMFCVILRPT